VNTLIKQGISLAILVFWGWTVCWAGETADYQISNLTFAKTDKSFTVTVEGKGVPTFTTYQLFDPLRVVVDIAKASFVGDLKLPMIVNQDPVVRITGKVLTDKKPFIAKLVIVLSKDWPYKIERQANDIVIKMSGASNPARQTAAVTPVDKTAHTASGLRPTLRKTGAVKQDAVGSLLSKLDAQATARSELAAGNPEAAGHKLTPKVDILKSQLKNVGITGDVFSDAGYDKQKISVDFYKINLHNVFRLIGEISGRNIVVDDSVSGSLTLALKNVPWDFVLDVVLNLKDLQKEERYNTIVISPKSKNFTWPENKKEQALEIEAPANQLQIKIDKQLAQPPAAMAADLIIQRADKLVKAGKIKAALQQYEAAYDKWPRNIDVAKQIANICLVDLGYNQKAVDYAEKVLAVDPQDRQAALLVAVGLANMHRPGADKYFARSVRGKRPTRAALVSYASYLENRVNLKKSLVVLGRYETLYGSDLDIMIAKARIYDKLKQPDKAVAEYRAISYSGYGLEPDLAKYIKGRIAVGVK